MNLFPKESRLLPAGFRILFFMAATAALFSRFSSHRLLLGSYQDDFFYYLKIVQNLATHGVSSFDGVHLTNGYHPLWMVTLLGLYWLLPGISFFLGLQLLTLLCALAFYAGAERVLRTLQIPDPTRSLITFLIAMQALLLLRYGMEITLALPLLVWMLLLFLQEISSFSSIRVIGLGFLAALTVLARLDTIILVALLLLAHLYTAGFQGSIKRMSLFLIGFSPVFLYFAINLHYFHVLMPVSGMAKQLKSGLLPSPIALLSVVRPLDRMKMIFILPCLTILALGIFYARRSLRVLPPGQAAILLAVITFPAVHLLVLSVLSDWVLWPWYLYPYVLSSLVCCALFCRLPLSSRTLLPRLLHPLALALSCAYLVYVAGYSILQPNSVHVYTSSAQLAAFMDNHPGTYAMGDQAGTTGYLAKEPIIQLEGLVMDADYLRKIKSREPLKQILADYHVSYYVTFANARAGHCITVREPSQAGPSSPVSTGTICSQPLATFYRMNNAIEVFPATAVQ